MDDFDRASELEEKQREIAILSQLRKSSQVKSQARGACLNCDEPFPGEPARLYCDADCAQDHQRRAKNAA